MTETEIQSTEPLVELLRTRGYTFTKTDWHPGPVEDQSPANTDFSWLVKSPRLDQNFLLRRPFDEDTFYRTEGLQLAWHLHAATLDAVFGGIRARILEDLAKLYGQRARGDDGVEIPSAVSLGDLRVPLKLDNPPVTSP